MQIYVVKEGDSVDRIGADFGVNPLDLAWVNQIEPPYRLAVGQALLVPDQTAAESGTGKTGKEKEGMKKPGKRQDIRLGGYAYPWINPEILEETAGYATEISVFSYGFTESGELIYPEEAGERRILEAAKRHGAESVLVLTTLGADGRFHSDLVSLLVQDETVQQRLIRGLWQIMEDKGYREINVDFEYVKPEDRDALVAFVDRLRTVLHVFGFLVSVAVAPKTFREQKGLLYEGIDYRGLGNAADRIFLMTYEWGYTYGPPMAVAPLPMVRRVVEYAGTEIEPARTVLGIPGYGYDWPLPYERGVTKAKSLGYLEAVQLAIDHGVPIYYDETAQSPYFYYWQYGIRHVVWFEDVRSVEQKYRLIREYGLAGGGFWQLMRLFRAGWLLAESMFQIEKTE